MKKQHSDITTGLKTKNYIDSRSSASGRDQSSAPTPQPTVLKALFSLVAWVRISALVNINFSIFSNVT